MSLEAVVLAQRAVGMAALAIRRVASILLVERGKGGIEERAVRVEKGETTLVPLYTIAVHAYHRTFRDNGQFGKATVYIYSRRRMVPTPLSEAINVDRSASPGLCTRP